MTGAILASQADSFRPALEQSLALVQSLRGLHRAPLWASLFPPASWYVISKSLSLETQTYLAREEAERRLTGYLRDLDAARAKAAAAPDAEHDPAPLLAAIAGATELISLVNQLEAEVATGQAAVNGDLARVADLPQAPLKILHGASWFMKYGVWLVAAAVVVVLFYAWRSGSIGAGIKRAAGKAAEVAQ